MCGNEVAVNKDEDEEENQELIRMLEVSDLMLS
jgi:hypothetical protein